MNPVIRDFLTSHPECKELPEVAMLLIMRFICPNNVVIGGTYRDFKGAYYKMLGLVRHVDGFLCVRYVGVNRSDQEYTMPINDFLGIAHRDEPRFTLIGG